MKIRNPFRDLGTSHQTQEKALETYDAKFFFFSIERLKQEKALHSGKDDMNWTGRLFIFSQKSQAWAAL
jgi:hypothetical protein